jgi:hypothetical protein
MSGPWAKASAFIIQSFMNRSKNFGFGFGTEREMEER